MENRGRLIETYLSAQRFVCNIFIIRCCDFCCGVLGFVSFVVVVAGAVSVRWTLNNKGCFVQTGISLLKPEELHYVILGEVLPLIT